MVGMVYINLSTTSTTNYGFNELHVSNITNDISAEDAIMGGSIGGRGWKWVAI